MKKIDFDRYTPAIASIGMTYPGGVSDGALRFCHNIKTGAEEFVDDGIPAELQADYAELHRLYESMDEEEKAHFEADYNAWFRRYNARLAEFGALWRARNYTAMIDLMRETEDPGLASRADKPDEDGHE